MTGQRAQDETATLLAEIDLFADLDDDALAELAGTLEAVHLPSGTLVMAQDDAADCLYVVQAGRLRVSIVRPDGAEQLLGHIGRGEVAGEMALLTHEPRSATVIADRDSQLLRLTTSAFDELIARHPSALRQITGQVVRRLQRALRNGTFRSPVVTVAVVPLSERSAVLDACHALASAVTERAGRVAVVGGDDALAALGCAPDELDQVTGETTRWTSALEQDHDLVLYRADPDPSAWTRLCLRQADLVVFVADSRSDPRLAPVEEVYTELRRARSTPAELVLVHDRFVTDPRATAAWLDRRDVSRHHHVRVDRPADIARVARLLLEGGVVLVLSGGGARCMAEIGVVRAMQELGIPIDAVAGTSAGALVGGAVARAWDHRRVEDVVKAGVSDGPAPVDPTFPAVSLASGRRVTARLQDASDDLDLEDLWLNFFCVSTNLSRNRRRVHRRGLGWRAIRASFAIPGVFPPVPDDGDVLVDGGMLDNLPVGLMREEHPGATVIAVDVGARRDLAADGLPESCVLSGWQVLWGRVNPLRRAAATVGIMRLLTRLTELGSAGIQDGDRGDVTVCPEVQDLPILDFDQFDEFVRRGHREGRRVLEAWLEERGSAEF